MDALERAKELGWYHTLELTPELTTAGMFDLRPYVDRYGIPADLTGKRALDIGTWDGFWAFELERRGADVVALDVDAESELDFPPRRRPSTFRTEPRGEGFHVAKHLLGSSVERVDCNVYRATPELLGTFDLVFCGTMLLHLRDQLLALERICSLVRPGGLFITAEEYDPLTSLLPWPASRYLADREKDVVFWLPGIRTWKRMLWSAGFDRVRRHARFDLRSPFGFSVPHVVHHAMR